MPRAIASWLSVAVALLWVAPALAQTIEYSDIDRATVRVLALDTVATYEVEQDGRRFVLAASVGGHGSGVAVTRDGLVLTAAHLVTRARSIAVHVPGTGEPLPATVVHVDDEKDVAFLSVAHEFSSFAELAAAQTPLEVRSPVFAVGYPLDVTRSDPQSAYGVLSGRLPDGRLQLSISLNPGNSGGPVVDSDGRVLGIVSARSDVNSGAVGLAAAVPLDSFRPALEHAMKTTRAQPSDARAKNLARLVSLVAHEGETLLRGLVRSDSTRAVETERQVRALLGEMPESSDAALLGAVFFWNRHVALLVHGGNPAAAHESAVELVHQATALDPQLDRESAFVRHVKAEGSKVDRALSSSALGERARPALVKFESDDAGVTLHVKRSAPSDETDDAGGFGRICTAPCEQSVATGSYQAALSRRNGELVRVKGAVVVDRPVVIEGKYQDFGWLRMAGYVVALGGAATGVGLIASTKERCEYDSARGRDDCSGTRPYLVSGLAVGLVSISIGAVMARTSDRASLNIRPGVAGASRDPGQVGQEGRGLRGLTLCGKF